MTEEGLRLGFAWVFGGGFMALALLFALANVRRHWQMYRDHKAGRWKRISGTPFASSLFFFLGWWIAPATFTPPIFLIPLILVAELSAFITIVPQDEESGPSPGPSADEGEEPLEPTP